MDRQEFAHRTQLLKEQVANDDLFNAVEQEARRDERVQAMAANIRGLRVAGKVAEADALVKSNRDLIDEVRRSLLIEHGISVEIKELEEDQEERRLNELRKITERLRGDETEDELLLAYHLTDENGHFSDDTLASPLFRERTRLGFEAYISAASSWRALVDYNRMFGVPSKNVPKADALKRDAHNAVAEEVAQDLGLDWSTARSLVAKIRDAKMPGAGEKDAYAKSIVRVGKRLSQRYHGDVSEAMKEKLEPILGDEAQGKAEQEDL